MPASPSTHDEEEWQTEEDDQGDHEDSEDGSKGPSESLLMSREAKPQACKKELQRDFADAVHNNNALNFIDGDQDMELNAAEDVPEYIEIDVAVDSGAGDHVLARVDAPGHRVVESPGSKRGQKFKGAGGQVMDNEGQILLEMLAPLEGEDFNPVDVTWQVTDVCRPLLSVSKVCDKAKHTVTFDDKRAVVRDSRGRIVCIFLRRGNLYIGRMKIKNPAHPSFGGQGK